jgi:hypothetical protein
MGAGGSRIDPLQALQNRIIPPPPVPDPQAEAEKLRIELNMAKQDVKIKQVQYDKLVPNEAISRKTEMANKEINSYTKEKNNLFNNELKVFNVMLDQVNTLANNGVIKIAKKYKDELEKRQIIINNQTKEKRETAFTNRRRMLDSEPQKPLTTFFSFESADAQVLLAFWISYILIICTICFVIVSKYGKYFGSPKAIFMTVSIFIVVMVIIAHTIIQAVATRQ